MAIGDSGATVRIQLCRGPRAAETALLADLERFLEGRKRSLPARPVLIIVPSHGLRSHLIGRIAARAGAATLGLACRTHRHVAVDLLERLSWAPPVNDAYASLLAARAARSEPSLRRALGHLDRGYAGVAHSVRDLLDAGLRPPHREALDEALEEEGPAVADSSAVDRAKALVRTATTTAAELERTGVASSADLLRLAAEAVAADGGRRCGPETLFVYGFGNATGVATDFLEALLRTYGGTVYLDQPPDPTARGRIDPGAEFTRRFRERLLGGSPADMAAEPPRAPRIRIFRAAGAHAEVRAVAVRLHRLLADGEAPERIGVVARRLEPYRLALREQLDRLGIPYSATGEHGPLLPAGRRLRALYDLLQQAERAPVDRWLEVQEGVASGVNWHLLRHALQSLGAGRLDEAARLSFESVLDRGSYRLRIGHRFSADQRQGSVGTRLVRRRLRARFLEAARQAARTILDRLAQLRRATTAGEVDQLLSGLVEADLGWTSESAETRLFRQLLRTATRGLAPETPLTASEFFELLEPALGATGRDRFGGAGGGVQIVDVTGARGRTFDHLFLLGLNRGVFPRTVREDPLLPDSLRGVLGRTGHGVLPDLSRKLEGFEEERYLFAQLLDAAPEVTLSWQELDEDGLALTPSPLVERLRWSGEPEPDAEWRDPPMAPHVHAPDGGGSAPPLRSAREIAILAGLFGRREEFAELLPAALEEAGRDAASARRLARLRIRLLDEVDPLRGEPGGEETRARLGPFFGLVGPTAGAVDPRHGRRLYVTWLEAMSTCPWRLFLQKVLRLERSVDPLESLPGMDGRLIGLLVHRVLDRLVAGLIGGGAISVDEAMARLPLGARWPPPHRVDAVVEHEAGLLTREQGIALPGFARALGLVVRGHLDTAHRLDWPENGENPPTVAVEAMGAIELAGPEGHRRQLYFRADRIDRQPTGLCLTDYKTGRRTLREASSRKQRNPLLAAVESGEWLQAVAYALAAGGENGRGRYLFLDPQLELEDHQRAITVSRSQSELVAAFERAVRRALRAWEEGLFFPRLVEAEVDREPRICSFCDVAEACLRHDSGSRLRLRDWAAAKDDEDVQPADRALLALWHRAPRGGEEHR